MMRRASEILRPGIRAACAVVAALLLFGASAVFAADEPVAATVRLEQIRAELDRVEASAKKPDQSRRALLQYREEIEPLRTELREIVEKVEPLHAQTEKLLKQLGPPPGTDKPPEALSVASEREQQTIAMRNIDAALRQARLLTERSEQIAAAIDEQRRAAFTGLFFERGKSFFAPALWLGALDALPSEWQARRALFADWYAHIENNAGVSNLALALLISFAIAIVILLMRAAARKWGGTRDDAPAGGEIPLLPQ
jgi:small-conductance mechanosensitive channel